MTTGRFIRRASAVLLGIVVLVTGVLTGTILWLRTDSGRSRLIATIESDLATPDQRLTITGLSGALPFEWRVERIDVADRAGRWLSVSGALLSINAQALWSLRLNIARFSITDIAVLRSPQSATAAPTTKTGSPFSLPSLPIAIQLDRLDIAHVTIDPSVLGTAIAAKLSGDARLVAGNADIDLSLSRLDQPGNLTVHAGYQAGPDGGGLTASVQADEPSGILLSQILLKGEKRPLSVSFSGSGPIDHWAGQLTAKAGADAGVSASLVLTRHASDLTVSLTGKAQLAALLNDPVRSALGSEVGFNMTGAIADAGPIGLDRLELRTTAAMLTGSGRYVPATGVVTARFNTTSDLTAWRSFAPPDFAWDLAGRLGLQAVVSGRLDAPSAELTIDAGQLVEAGNTIDSATGIVEAVTQPDGLIHVTGKGRLAGILMEGFTPATPSGDTLDLAIDAVASRDGSRVSLTKASVAGTGVDLDAAGSMAGGTLAGHATFASDDIARLAALAGLNAAGAVHVDAEARQADGSAIEAKLTGRLGHFRLGIPAVDAALGPEVALDAAGSRDPSGAFDLSAFTVTGTAVSLTGTGHYDQGANRAALHAVLVMPSLEPIGKAVGRSLAGSVRLTADADGTASAPGGTLNLNAAGLSVDDSRIDHLAASFVAADFSRKSGVLAAEATSGQIVAKLGATLSQPAPETIAITGLALSGPATDAHGDVNYNLKTAVATGMLSGQSRDLSAWTPLIGTSLAGRISLAVKLADKGGQQVDAHIDGIDLAYGTGPGASGAARIQADTHVTMVRGQIGGTADLDIATARAPQLAIDAVRVRAASDKSGAFDVDLTASGETRGRKFAVASRGTAKADSHGQSLALASFDGSYGDLKARLNRLLRIDHHGTSIDVQDLAVSLNGGSVAGNLTLDDRQISAAIKASALPIARIASIAGQESMTGSADLDLSVAGPLPGPKGSATLKIDQLRFADEKTQGAPVTVSVAATLAPRGVALRGRVADIANQAGLDLSGTVPLSFAANGLPSLPRDGIVKAHVAGDGKLETLTKLVPIGEDKLAGAYKIDLSIDGTVAAPQASGSLTLSDGSYDNGASGMTLRGMRIEVTGDHQNFVLRRLTATDGADGKVSASGRLDLAVTPSPALDLSATLTGFKATRRDDVTAVLSGTAKVSGTMTAPVIASDLTLDRAEVNIPQRLPAGTPTLAVIRIDSRTPRAVQIAQLKAARVPSSDRPFVAKLDIKIHDAGQTFVRGDGLVSEWKGDIAVAGTATTPDITGSLQAINGTLSVLGKDFAIERGDVYFVGSASPTFDIQTQYASGTITAQAELTGTADQPKLTLTSTPSLPQDEILSRVMFGSGVGQISPAEGLEVASAAASLVSGGPGMLDRLRSTTGLDRLGVGQESSATNTSSTASNSQSTAGTTVSGGKYVVPGVFVGVDQGVSGGSTRARVEVSVFPNVTVNAIAGASANSGSSLGAQYRVDY